VVSHRNHGVACRSYGGTAAAVALGTTLENYAMTDKESPGAAGTPHRAIELDELDGRVVSECKRLHDFDQAPIRATLIGSDRCEIDGIVARGHAPVMGLCRALIAAGHDPRRPLYAYRGDTLALIIQSIGEGAPLTVEDDRQGRPRLRRWRQRQPRCGATSLVAQIAEGHAAFDQRNGD
jgi:hypothetical protein